MSLCLIYSAFESLRPLKAPGGLWPHSHPLVRSTAVHHDKATAVSSGAVRGGGVLLRDTSTPSLERLGLEPATFPIARRPALPPEHGDQEIIGSPSMCSLLGHGSTHRCRANEKCLKLNQKRNKMISNTGCHVDNVRIAR